jgi:hypothetical protein
MTDAPCDTEPTPDTTTPYRALIEVHVQLVLSNKGDAEIIARSHRFGDAVALRSVDIAHASVELRLALEKYARTYPFKGAS